MKVRSLHFGKALSAALFVLLLSLAGMKNALAQTLVATLQHGDSVSFYYGSNAMIEAYEACEAGDIITLSSGTFATPWEGIIKDITLRGAGCVADSISGVQPTVFSGDVVLGMDEASITVEGICFSGTLKHNSLSHPTFVKCSFNVFTYNSWDKHMVGAQFSNCKFNEFNCSNTNNNTLINCVVWKLMGNNSETSLTAFNSILGLYNGHAQSLSAYNCIIIRNSWTLGLTDYSVAYNCIGIKQINEGQGDNPLFMVTTFDCVEYDELTDVFESFEGFENDNIDFTEPFILKSDIATSFLGNDGTEVGLYGGFMPYTARPSYQIVKRYNVPNKSDAQGHLNVGLELYSEDE